jgi:molybdenum cofactor cytidylyltransferase
MTVCGILLAAGASTRFGSDKLLHALPGGTPIAVAAARSLFEALPESVAVVRSPSSRLAQALRAEGLRIAVCRDASEGMGRSLAAGVRATPDASGWVVALADMPFVRPATIRAVAGHIDGGAVVAAPAYRGERGHPVGFASSLGADLQTLRGDAGAREMLIAHPDWVTLFAVDDPGILRDIDTQADLPKQAQCP